jgi:hypothetical protein
MKNRCIAVALGLKVLDNISTAILVNHHGMQVEINPIARWSMEMLGIQGALFLNFFLFAAAMLVAHMIHERTKKGGWIFPFTCGLYLAVVANNLYNFAVG